MVIKLKRIYEEPSRTDGYRVLVDRLWPRGLAKDRARIDEWAKEIAPSNELRKWFHADRAKWSEFKRQYFAELNTCQDRLRELVKHAQRGHLTLLYAATDTERNHAVVLAEYLEKLDLE